MRIDKNRFWGILLAFLFAIGINLIYSGELLPGSQFNYLGGGVRELSLGYGGLTELGSIEGVTVNPAALGDIRRLANSFSVIGMTSSNHLYNLGLAIPTLGGNISFNFRYINTTDSYSGLGQLYGGDIGFSKTIIDGFYWGTSIGFDYADVNTISTNDWQLSASMGLIYRITGKTNGAGMIDPTFGFALKNMGKTIRADTNYNGVPALGIGLGFSFYPFKYDNYSLRLFTDLNVPFNPAEFTASIAMEQVLFDLIKFRAGYIYDTTGQLGPFTLGVGITGVFLVDNKSTDLDISYAMAMHKTDGVSEITHSVGVSVAWGYYDDKAPEVSIEAERIYFSPNYDGSADELVLNPVVDDNTLVDKWQLDIMDADGNTIKTFKSVEDLQLRNLSIKKFFKQIFSKKEDVEIPETLSWDGQNENGEPVDDGTYYYVLNAWDENGNKAQTSEGEIVIDTVVPAVTPQPDYVLFSPNKDGAKDVLTFSLSDQNIQDDDEIKAEIIDADGNVVKTYDYKSEVPDEIVWDGTDNKNLPVKEGQYSFKIAVKDSAGNKTENVISELRLVTNYQKVNLSINNTSISPNNDGYRDNIVFKPTVNDQNGLESWVLEVRDTNSNVVKTLSGTDELPDEIAWNGRDDDGKILPDGDYTYQLKLVYDSGNFPMTDPMTITIDTTAPQVQIDPEYMDFSPNYDEKRDTLMITHEVSGQPEDTLQVTIEDEYGSIVYFGKYKLKDFPAEFEWTGLDRDLNPLPEGKYNYIIKASDSVGNNAVYSVNSISLMTGLEKVSVQSDVLAISPGNYAGNYEAMFTPEVTSTEGISNFALLIKNDAGDVVKTFQTNIYLPYMFWEGNGDDETVLPDGDYRYLLNVVYVYGDEPASMTKKIAIDTVAPQITISPNYNVFSPNGDGRKEAVTVSMTADGDEADEYVLIIYDALADEPVESYVWEGEVPEELVWTGLDSYGEELPEGAYVFELTGSDTAGNETSARTEYVWLVRDFETVVFSGSSTYLSPNNDDYLEYVTFNAELSSTVGLEKSTFKITRTKTLEAVATISNGANDTNLSTSSYEETVRTYDSDLVLKSITWKGKDDSGYLVTDGIYNVSIRYEFDSGNVVTATISNIIVDSTPPTYSLNVTPTVFTPDDDGENDTLFISLKCNDQNTVAKWFMKIYKDDDDMDYNTPFKTFEGFGDVDEVFEWDGYSDDGEDLVESVQDYSLVFGAMDALGNIVSDVEKDITVGVLVEETEDGLKIRISSITFDYNKATLSTDSKAILDKVIYIIRKIISDPEKYGLTTSYSIQITGHTDDTGTDAYNLTLSEKRAKTVYDYLIDKNINTAKLSYKGEGESKPYKEITDDLTDTKKTYYRSLNRRVEFFIKK